MTALKSSPSEVEVRAMAAGDVAQVASLHRRVFPDYFLSHLGYRFLRRYYLEFVERAGNHGFVAAHGGALVGFVVGTVNSASLYRGFYRRNFLRLAPITVARVLVDPFILRNIAGRMSHVGYAVRSLLAPGADEPTSQPTAASSHVPARLLSIGVAHECRGCGIAEELVRQLCRRLSQEGFGSVGLSVRVDNSRAIGFYEKTGWQREPDGGSTVGFVRPTQA